ncbi:hypothetical protein [Streptomyces sp. NPDC000880]
MTRRAGRTRRRLFEREAELAATGPPSLAPSLHLDEQAVTRLLFAVHRKAGTDEAGLAEASEALAVARDGGRGR